MFSGTCFAGSSSTLRRPSLSLDSAGLTSSPAESDELSEDSDRTDIDPKLWTLIKLDYHAGCNCLHELFHKTAHATTCEPA